MIKFGVNGIIESDTTVRIKLMMKSLLGLCTGLKVETSPIVDPRKLIPSKSPRKPYYIPSYSPIDFLMMAYAPIRPTKLAAPHAVVK